MAIEGTKLVHMILVFRVPPGMTPEAFTPGLASGVSIATGLGPWCQEVKLETYDAAGLSGLKLT